MTSALPDIDFRQIRPFGQPASRSSGFEELASILIEQGVVEWPTGTKFTRFGNPDGGREGRGALPDGSVWVWQAKYLFEFDASAAGQVAQSLRRALDTEAALTRYFVAMPLDMPAGDTKGRTSAHSRWVAEAAKWEAMAREKGLTVEFAFIGAHQLTTALTESRHAGRARYWFDAKVMTPDWQGRRLEEAIAKVGPRYSPKLNVEVEAAQAFDAVGRTESYTTRWQQTLAQLREATRLSWRAPTNVAEAFADALPECATALDALDAELAGMIAATRTSDRLPLVDGPLGEGARAVRQVSNLLHEHCLTKDRYFVGDAASLYSDVERALEAIRLGEELADAEITRAARDKLLLLVGRAGVGKTHLLCDVAERRIREGRPTLLLLGQDFDHRSLLTQIGDLTQLGGSLDDVFGVLDSSAEAAGCVGLFMIDALNESERPERWSSDARALRTAAARWPRIAVVLTCRMEFVKEVIGDWPNALVEHVGFAEATDVAVRRFAQEYGLEPPTFPVLNPEFSNPLFLKLTCDALATLGAGRFPFGSAGLAAMSTAFLEAVNRRLSGPSRCNYDERSDPVSRAIRAIAMVGRVPLDRSDVERITSEALPERTWSRSLMRGLLAEGVLNELGDGRITFGYQRLGDVARAEAIAERSLDEVRRWLNALGDDRWRERGVLGALGVIVPEHFGIELVDMAADSEGRVSYDFVDGFLESLLLRSPGSVSARTLEIVQGLLDRDLRLEDVWDHLVRLACIPGHPLDAEWLHAHLMHYEVAERDRRWSTWLMGAADADEWSAVRRLIDWAWPANLGDRIPIPDEVAILASKVLGWFLTTSDRRVRDRSTKALVSIADRAPAAFATALGQFKDTNDPYVVERLTAAACGAVYRTQDPKAVQLIADGVAELVSVAWPIHLVTRDFVRRVFGAARSTGWPGADGLPPYGAMWPVSTKSIAEIESLAGPPSYAYGSIWHSLAGFGDFGHYVLEPALGRVATEDEGGLLEEAARAVFDRALDLGWTPERFQEVDGRLSGGGRQDRMVERIGKKYEWIGFYEILGRMADHYPVKGEWGDDGPQPYSHVEQLVWRDLDPTLLVRKPTASREVERPWFSPVAARFAPGTATDFPSDMAGVPDPLDLIAVSDPAGVPWLVLESRPMWEQPQPVEIEALRTPRLAVWLNLRAYLIPLGAVTSLREWAKDQDWYGAWMPDSADVHNVLLGAHPGDPEWSAADGAIGWWERQSESFKSVNPLQCLAWYGGTGTGRDKSAEEETRGYVPTRRLFDLLKLSRGVDFAWTDSAGLAVCDPSVVLGGPSCLVMRRDLVSRLADEGVTLFWTALVGKELHRGDDPAPHDDYRWITASASYILDGGRIRRLASRARRCRPGPLTERELEWTPSRGEV